MDESIPLDLPAILEAPDTPADMLTFTAFAMKQVSTQACKENLVKRIKTASTEGCFRLETTRGDGLWPGTKELQDFLEHLGFQLTFWKDHDFCSISWVDATLPDKMTSGTES